MQPNPMRIGEILLLREALDPWGLSNAIQEQPATGMRLVSMLVSRALIDPDDASLALSEKYDVPGAMQRHLERRDPAIVDIIPAELARRWILLPLGRSRRGGLVVVARDPSPFLHASLEHIVKTEVELAVTPALQLERLVRSVYGELQPLEAPVRASESIPRRALEDELLGDLPGRPRTVSRLMLDTSPDLPRRSAPSITKELDGTLQQIETAVNRAAAEQHAIQFASRRWSAGMLLVIGDGAMFGRRAFGAKISSPESVILPLGVPSLVQHAIDSRTATAQATPGALHQRLCAMLGGATQPIAAPIVVRDQVEAVMVVGDPATTDLQGPLTKLASLADALGGAYERFAR